MKKRQGRENEREGGEIKIEGGGRENELEEEGGMKPN